MITSLRVTVSKVPEVTVWFWLIKILCTTVGESLADWVNMRLGVGLGPTAGIFTVVLAVVLVVQVWLPRYVPVVYWLTVVALSVTGTLYTDILTDKFAVPLDVSTLAFAVTLMVVFGVWFVKERTLSIHSITTTPRELFYWLAVLVTFALGTAVGDWTLTLTGWGPGVSVLLPVALIGVVVVGWRFGLDAVLSFWLAYILTRPLGANLGDWLAAPRTEYGLGLGYGVTSAIFLVAIAAAVLYLTLSRADVIDTAADQKAARTAPTWAAAAYYVIVAVAAGSLLVWAHGRPHRVAVGEEESSGSPTATLAPGGAHVFPSADINGFRVIVQDTLAKVDAGDQPGARARIADLETAWDRAEDRLRAMDAGTWEILDHQIDAALHAVRSSSPDIAGEKRSLATILVSLR